MPDISLLIPFADILGVTVTKLLEGQEMDVHSKEYTTFYELTKKPKEYVLTINNLRASLVQKHTGSSKALFRLSSRKAALIISPKAS